MNEEVVVCIIVCLHHINLLLDLLGHLLYLFLIAPCGDGVLVNIGYARCRHIQTLDIYLSASKHRRYLVQDARNVF